MINIEIEQLHCIMSNENNKNARRLKYQGSDQAGIFKRRIVHKWYYDDTWRVDVFYNNDESINKILLSLISCYSRKLIQENIYKKNILKKVIHYNPTGYDLYIFKNGLLIEESMIIYKENVNADFNVNRDWEHTKKFYDYENKLIRIYSYSPEGNRIQEYDKIEKMS